jgi:hypothetical protein
VNSRGRVEKPQDFRELLHGNHRAHYLKINARDRIRPDTREEATRTFL